MQLILKKLKISVCVVTFNHEKYIDQCLQSLVDQITDFNYEVIVGDDCSTDSTRYIIEKYTKKYPEKVILIAHENNVGTVENALSLYRRAKGQYICHVDGDDFALPNKLSSQAKALDLNTDCSICTHDVKLVDSKGTYLNRTFRRFKTDIYRLEDLLGTLPFFAHSSKMFRNDLDKEFWAKLTPMALDIEVHVEQVLNGNIYHIDEPLGAYRILTGTTIVNRRVSPHLPEGTRRLFKRVAKLSTIDQVNLDRYLARSFFAYAYQSGLQGDNKDASLYIKESLSYKYYSFSQIVFYVSSLIGISVYISRFLRSMRNIVYGR